ETLAKQYPKTDNRIWQLSRRIDAVQLYLRAAGASDWQTWTPQFRDLPAPVAQLNRGELYDFDRHWREALPGVWDSATLADLPTLSPDATLGLPTRLIDLGTITGRVGHYARMRALLSTGDELWLIAPGIIDVINQDRPHRIWSISPDRVRG